MSVEPLDPASAAKPEGWPPSLPWDAALWARTREANKDLPPLTDEQVRRIAPLINAAIGAPSATRTAS